VFDVNFAEIVGNIFFVLSCTLHPQAEQDGLIARRIILQIPLKI
jgi:hypothetical protein